MNLKIILLLCLVTILVLTDDSDAWGGRRRRRWRIRVRVRRAFRWVCSISCKIKGCSYVNYGGGVVRYVCHRVCGRVCRKIFGKKKRDEQESPRMIQDDPLQSLYVKTLSDEMTVRQPARLSKYDANKDGRISRAEFVAIQPRKTDQKSIEMAFDSMDTNGDHYIDCKEFLKAKLEFEAKPKC